VRKGFRECGQSLKIAESIYKSAEDIIKVRKGFRVSGQSSEIALFTKVRKAVKTLRKPALKCATKNLCTLGQASALVKSCKVFSVL